MPQTPPTSTRWRNKLVLAFRLAWSLTLGVAASGLIAQETSVSPFIWFPPAMAVAWWLSGTFGKRQEAGSGKKVPAIMTTFAALYIKSICAGISGLLMVQLLQDISGSSVPAVVLACIAGLAVGFGWFRHCRRYTEAAGPMRLIGPFSLPFGMALLSIFVKYSAVA